MDIFNDLPSGMRALSIDKILLVWLDNWQPVLFDILQAALGLDDMFR